MPIRTIPAGFSVVGEQKLSLTGTAQVGLNSTVRGSSHLLFSVESAPARMSYASNSTSPLTTTGVLYQKDAVYELAYNGTARLKFATAQSTASTVNVIGLKYAGEI